VDGKSGKAEEPTYLGEHRALPRRHGSLFFVEPTTTTNGLERDDRYFTGAVADEDPQTRCGGSEATNGWKPASMNDKAVVSSEGITVEFTVP